MFLKSVFTQAVLAQAAFVHSAFAQEAPAGRAAQPSTLEMFVPFIFIFVIFYFLIIRPQSKRQKEHQGFLKDLKRGDEIVTASGIYGKIDEVGEQHVLLDVGSGVRLKMLKSQVAISQKAQKKEGK